MLMNSQEGMNLKNPYARELAILNKKRNKQDEDHEKISDLEMRLKVYWDKERDVPIAPTFNVIRCVQDGGKQRKLGKKIIQGIRIDPRCEAFEVVYQPRLPLEQFLVAPEYRDVRTVGTPGGTVRRTRPIFNRWGLRGFFLMDPEMLSLEELKECIRIAGIYVGYGDFRVGTDKGGRYGTFEGGAEIITAEEVAVWN